MNTYVKINNNLYKASATQNWATAKWGNREYLSILFYEEDPLNINNILQDNTQWSIIVEEIHNKAWEEEEPVYETTQTEYDKSEYCVKGDFTIHPDGTCTILMGKHTALEEAYELLYGGIE